jgi:Arc/MetJ-type ribon-helix-helix transcriptional regulator
MTIHLSEDREQVILSLLRTGEFAWSDEVIDKALRLVGERYQATAESKESAIGSKVTDSLDQTGQQLANLRRLDQTLDCIPTAVIADGLSNWDHDRLLYARRPRFSSIPEPDLPDSCPATSIGDGELSLPSRRCPSRN